MNFNKTKKSITIDEISLRKAAILSEAAAIKFYSSS